MATAPSARAAETDAKFRFYDNRQKYLAFVTTCNEKAVIGPLRRGAQAGV